MTDQTKTGTCDKCGTTCQDLRQVTVLKPMKMTRATFTQTKLPDRHDTIADKPWWCMTCIRQQQKGS